MSDFKRRYLEPFLLPMSAFVFVGGIAWGLSRILLATTKNGAAALAMVAAITVLLGATVIAARGLHLPQKIAGVLAFIGVVAGGSVFAATLGIRPIHGHLPPPSTTIVAHGPLKFDEATLTVPVKDEVVVRFDNQDPNNAHNWQVVKSKSDPTAIVEGGAPFKGPASHDYVLKSVPEGSYYYFCQVHPATMTGTLLVGSAKAPAAGAPSVAPSASPAPNGSASGKPSPLKPPKTLKVGTGPKSAVQTAKGVAFLNRKLALRASAPDTIVFKNEDPQTPHNIEITKDAAFATPIFTGAIFAGVADKTYSFIGPPAGSYYFRCQVHPSMTGTVAFS